jgi:protein-L-isoaspartate(D-aspartate) O-methyltransferase
VNRDGERQHLVARLRRHGISDERVLAAMAAVPREAFVDKALQAEAYDDEALPIACGQTISQPYIVAYMTEQLAPGPDHRVLEIGTGSGYQSSVLSHLTNNVYTVEIIEPLHQRTKKVYENLVTTGFKEFENVHLKTGDGYYGWEEMGPFNKIIVTCAIDHIPPPLLKQLAPGGIMVIPVGPPGGQNVLAVQKQDDGAGNVTITRRDIYNGKKVAFVPFTKLIDGQISGTHSK